MSDLGVSIGLLACIVLCSEAMRRAARRLCSTEDYRVYLVEAVSTFQLCACTHELKLLAEMGSVASHVALTLTYTMTTVHIATFSGASCNPAGVLESLSRGTTSAGGAVACVCAQFAAAVVARFSAAAVWSLGLSELHTRYGELGYRCWDPLGGTVLQAAGVELACAFCVQAAVLHLHRLDARLRIHAVAAVITLLVYAGLLTPPQPITICTLQFCTPDPILFFCWEWSPD